MERLCAQVTVRYVTTNHFSPDGFVIEPAPVEFVLDGPGRKDEAPPPPKPSAK